MGDVGDYYRDLKEDTKERRKKARDGAHKRMCAFFRNNGLEFEEGVNTIIFRTENGTVVYYPPSQRMQHKNQWFDCSPTFCKNYVNKQRGITE